ncbi:MAG TPA: hypothetical protein VFZ97_12580 [Acidimicrobiales bacterium]
MDWLPVSSLTSSVYRVPTETPESDGTLTWSQTTVVVAQVSAGDRTGLDWTYGSAGWSMVINE